MKGEKSNHFEFYDEETGLQVKLKGGNRLFFKNQKVGEFSIDLPFLDFCVNILCGDAKDILTLSRNKVREEYEIKLRNDILISTYKYIIQEFDHLPDDDEYDMVGNSTKQLAAAFIDEVINHTGFQQIIEDKKLQEYWKKLKIRYNDDDEQKKTIGELLNSEKTEYIDCNHNPYAFRDLAISFHDNPTEVFQIRGGSLATFLLRKAHHFFKGIQFNAKGTRISNNTIKQYIKEDGVTRYLFLNEVCYRRYDRPHAVYGSYGLSFLYPKRILYSRENMPCNEKYDALRINSDWYEPTFYGFNFNVPVMLCPYIRTPDNNLKFLVDDQLIDYVYEHRYHPDVTKEKIKEIYDIFHQDFKKAEVFF